MLPPSPQLIDLFLLSSIMQQHPFVISGSGLGTEVLTQRIEDVLAARAAKANKPEGGPPAVAAANGNDSDDDNDDGNNMGTMVVQDGDEDEEEEEDDDWGSTMVASSNDLFLVGTTGETQYSGLGAPSPALTL
jgi:hypothetical protein